MKTIQTYKAENPHLSDIQLHACYQITEIDAPEFAVMGFTLIAEGKVLKIESNGNISPLRLKESY